jgi:putative FmdB family regulatory protein
MPTYEYECKRCGHTFEKFHSISASPPKRCPKCRGKVSRLIGTGAGLLFKGSGFYITDYRSDSYRKASKAEQGGGSTPAATEKSGSSGSSPSTPAKSPAS